MSCTPDPPSTCHIHSLEVPNGAVALDATTYFPSGVQSAPWYLSRLPFVIWLVSARSTEIVQRFSAPSMSETNRILLPSGLNLGCPSKAMPLVKGVASPPENGMVYRSPRRSKTMVCPSGLTSREIQDPSSVVSEIVRAASRGRSFFSFFWSAAVVSWSS